MTDLPVRHSCEVSPQLEQDFQRDLTVVLCFGCTDRKGSSMSKNLTTAQKKADNIRGKGRVYRGGLTREEVTIHTQVCQESLDCVANNPREKYVSQVQEMLDFLDRINPPCKEWVKKTSTTMECVDEQEEVTG